MTTENPSGTEAENPAAPVRRTRARRAASAPTTTVTAAPLVEDAVPPQESGAVAQPTSEPVKKARAPRSRAKKKVDAPANQDALDLSTGSDEDAATAASDTAAPEPAPTAAPRRRRATAKAQAPAASSASGSTPAQDVPVEDEPAAAQAGSTKDEPSTGRSSRSRRRKAEPQEDRGEAAADAPSSPVAEEETPSSQEAPRARRGRSRGARATAGPDTTSAESERLDVLAELGRSRPQPAAEPEKPVDPAEEDEPAEDDEESTAAVEPVRPAATALLFQAPDPTARPRRRAQAPAGPPRPVDEDEVAEAEPSRPSARPEAASQDEDADQGASEDEGSAGGRRRRRRGGRGRRKGAAESAEDREDEDEDGTDGSGAEREEEPARATGGRRGRRGRAPQAETSTEDAAEDAEDQEPSEDGDVGEDGDNEGGSSSSRRRRRRRRSKGEQAEDSGSTSTSGSNGAGGSGRSRSRAGRTASDEVTALKGSTRLEAKRQRRREGRDAGRRRAVLTEAEFLARREAVERSMVVRESNGRVQIAVLEDDVLVEHFVSRSAQNAQSSMAGNVYLGRVQNVLPSMEAAFVDVGKGRNAVLYAGEVNWDAAGMEGQPRRIEQALKSGDSVLVQVTKDPIGHKGARLTSQITLAGRYLVYVPGGGMTGISRKLPENERARLKKLLKEIVPDAAGVIVRTAAEGASDEELRRDVQRLQDQWAAIEKKAKTASAPALLQGEPDLAIRVVRDIFNDDFTSLVVQGDEAWTAISDYVGAMAPDLADRVSRWTEQGDVFAAHRIDEQLAKGMDRKVWLPSGGSLVIDRTEAMTVVDVNTGKFTGTGGTLEETVTRNNLEAAEEIVRQLRLRDIGGIIVIDFIDMVLESNRDLVLRRLVECLGRDRTKHQVAEVTSLGLVQMTRKRVGQGLVEAFSETCEHCHGRGFHVLNEPVEAKGSGEQASGGGEGDGESKRSRRKKGASQPAAAVSVPVLPEAREAVKATLATIAAAAAHAHDHDHEPVQGQDPAQTQEGSADQHDGAAQGSRAAEAELEATVRSIEAVEQGDHGSADEVAAEEPSGSTP
ncbi:Rne/Rng family ribonuclease [Actinotalea sp. BY-33]|uniref:Ribonuclease E n=1 Tax=Actinotalea soli TaxID=2819234 RepID=A0A939LMK2_9CELL|nr:Rne/Rng family ribonuclease [Actinotalea soli]MBO1750732.1 Rne/Rng family ribonuclease [Actinotalea soli]